MSKDLKDLIEQAEEEQDSRAFLEKTIEKLKAEVVSLKNKIGEKKSEFKIEPIRHNEEYDQSNEMNTLKSMVSSLRNQLYEKEQDNDTLNKELAELKIEFEKAREEMFNSAKDEMIIKTQNSLNSLIQDYGKLEIENKSLKNKLSKLHEELEGETEIKVSLQSEMFNKEQLEKEIGKLNSKIYDLESNNQSLVRKINNLETVGDSEKIEEMIEILKIQNSELEKQNQNLNQKLESLKREKLKVQTYETEITQLKSQIEQLRDLNQQLKDKDSILLAKTITAISSSERKKPPTITHLKPQAEVLPSKPMLKKVESIEVKSDNDVSEKKPSLETFNEVQKIEETKNIEKVPEETDDGSIARKWQCPQCGNTNKAQIRELDDKTRVIYSYPKIYAKKYICGQCGKEWR
jgi:chromosome segregation ATPase